VECLPNTNQELEARLAAGMGPKLHWFPANVSTEELAAVMVGMANVAGGSIFVGVAPRSGKVLGVTDPDDTIDRIFQASLLSDPPLILPVPRLQPCDHAEVIVVQIPPGLPHVYSLNGRFLVREGVYTNPLPARRLRRLLVERGVVQFESQVPPGATLADLDADKITAYVQLLDLPGDEAPEQVLLRRGCLKLAKKPGAAGDAYLPTYAALLLFGHHPQQWLPNATILAARFTGISFAERFIKQDIAGALPDQLRQAEAFLRANLQSVVRLVGLAHQETLEYPFEAVRELLVNAVAHRDYNLQGDNIHLNLFSDRLEVISPGGLPGPVTLDNLLEARFSRNAVIVQVLADMGFVERLGYGLDRVVSVMQQQGLEKPRFQDIAGSFRVTLRSGQASPDNLPDLSAYLDLGLNSRQEQALAFLAQKKRITNRDYQKLCPDVHAETLRRDLVDLVKRGILIKIGDKRATYYILK